MRKIKERDATARGIVDQLAEQHARLKSSGDALALALDDIVNGSITTREHVESPGRAYIADFRSHMNCEETTILPLAANVLQDSDWAAIDAAILRIEDPLFGKSGGAVCVASQADRARSASIEGSNRRQNCQESQPEERT